MKRIVLFFAIFSVSAACFAISAGKPVNFEKEGDKYFSLRNSITDTAANLVNMEQAISNYKLAFEADKNNEKLLLKYGKALDFKCRFLTPDSDRKSSYEALVAQFEPYGKSMSQTKEYNYLMSLFWGQRGDYTPNVLEAAKEGVGDKIKFYSEALYGMDKSFEDYAACTILGRLHFKAPYIVFIMTWPDKSKSRAYLEEVHKGVPDDPQASHFLADTYWDLGLKDEAVKLLKEAINAQPRKTDWYYDTAAIGKAKVRAEELGIE